MLVLAIQGEPATMSDGFDAMLDVIGTYLPVLASYAPIMLLFFVMNFLILLGPMLLLGIQQIKGYEPGDTDWGVKLDDIRGQAGGQGGDHQGRVPLAVGRGVREGGRQARARRALPRPARHRQDDALEGHRDVVQLPLRDDPGLRVRADLHRHRRRHRALLARKAKKLAAKWGGQCIVFIDEIDAVGMRRARSAPGSPRTGPDGDRGPPLLRPDGALTPDGDLVIESRRWRDRLFAQRAEPPGALYPQIVGRIKGASTSSWCPAWAAAARSRSTSCWWPWTASTSRRSRRVMTNRLNTFLDALYVVPRRVGPVSLRLRPPKPRKEEIYFIGACNVPLETLDPALTRPGRMGRHIYFRTPTWEDRRDIFDLYITKVAHEEDLDAPRRGATARARHLRRLAGDDRPGLLDGADLRALRRPRPCSAGTTSSRR